jgi:hypothetical protein
MISRSAIVTCKNSILSDGITTTTFTFAFSFESKRFRIPGVGGRPVMVHLRFTLRTNRIISVIRHKAPSALSRKTLAFAFARWSEALAEALALALTLPAKTPFSRHSAGM